MLSSQYKPVLTLGIIFNMSQAGVLLLCNCVLAVQTKSIQQQKVVGCQQTMFRQSGELLTLLTIKM
jgi:hypothetical protein